MPAVVEFDTIAGLFRALFDRNEGTERTAMRYKDRESGEWVGISWDDLRDRVHAFAGYLHAHGVRRGDRVAILSENRPEWAIADMATQMLGGVSVALYTSLPADQVGYIVRDAGAKLLITSARIQRRKGEEVFDACPELEQVLAMQEPHDDEWPEFVRMWDDAIEEGRPYWEEHEDELLPLADETEPGDICALIYTSGTTGKPKGVMLTHLNFVSNACAALDVVPLNEDDLHLSFLPLCHSFERTAGYTAILAGGGTIVYAESIEAVSKNLLEVSPTVMISVPRLFEKVYNTISKQLDEGPQLKKKLFEWSVRTGKRAAQARIEGRMTPWLKAQDNLAHRLVFSKLHEKLGGRLRFAVSGGAALPKAIGEFFLAAGITIIEGYGLTETAPVLAANPIDEPRYGTVGYVLPGVTVGIQDLETGALIGEVEGDAENSSVLTCGAGEIVARGPNVMKGYWNDEESTRAAFDEEGWYHTGDVGRFVDGYLQITDRIKHMLVSQGGKNIYPGPIEDEFKTVSFIDQMVIVGEGRPYLTALVVPEMDALKQFARQQDVSYESTEELLAHEKVQGLFKKEFRSYSRSAASHEKIRGFHLLAEPFSVENRMLTPTMKPRRSVIEETYSDVIEGMYGAYA